MVGLYHINQQDKRDKMTKIPQKESYEGEFVKFANVMLFRALEDALWLIVPEDVQGHVKEKCKFIAKHKTAKGSHTAPKVEDVITARSWILNDAYSKLLAENDLTFEWCCEVLGVAPDVMRSRCRVFIQRSQEAELYWLPYDLEKVVENIIKIKSSLEDF